ncbi:putative phospholipid-transporting ATPase DRS2 [Colletotrichum shisoi]|uniref:Putative phospholipid-transporting ATPase DRS2 n=1 Tax=Colletotrichum shisoi TaxID=2078593 RepID=A0A5Q4C4G1_9PEZI|nr:putative phospholipid-transporting ATPase DRS2 [Colletotrichum shisoi]
MGDLSIFHEPSDTPAGVNNTNNLDDLGQISFVFTDKTDTLTENIMNIRRSAWPEIGISWLHPQDLGEAESSVVLSQGAGFTTDDMRNHMRAEPTSPSTISATRFLLAMALCHTCLPETDAEGCIQYEGSSPDEVSLARGPGRQRTAQTAYCFRALCGTRRIRPTDEPPAQFLPAWQTRIDKVATRHRIVLLAPVPTRLGVMETISGMTDEYGSEDGMILQAQQASRTGPSEPIDSFAPRSDEERGSLSRRRPASPNARSASKEVGEMIEHSLHLLGASAVENKLQEGVPETIQKLRRANIKICMLTGDKRETAINIAHSTQICGPDSSMSILDVDEGDPELQLRNAMKKIEAAEEDTDCSGTTTAVHTALAIDGKTLGEIEQSSSERIRQLFYALVLAVDSVICCRASPSQKALLITIVTDGGPTDAKPPFLSACLGWFKRPIKPLTLAIGDGANDVAMIMTASVGVGISGREGQQAARVADLSISRFRYLGRLMLVHGRYSYRRTAVFILTTLWKEMFIFLPQGLFQEDCGVTGTSLYQSTHLIFISFLTGASMIIRGTRGRVLSPTTLMAIPELYTYGQKREALSMAIFLGWMGNAVIAGSVAFQIPWLGYATSELVRDTGLFAQGTLTILEMYQQTKIAIWPAIGSIAGLWINQLINTASSAPSSTPYSVKDGLTSGFGPDASLVDDPNRDFQYAPVDGAEAQILQAEQHDPLRNSPLLAF